MADDMGRIKRNDRGEALLAGLREFPAGRIYTLAPRDEVLAAMTLLRTTPVREVTWSRDRSLLTIEVEDPEPAEVTLSLADGEPRYACDCGARRGCRHLVVALVTLKKLLMPESFRDIRLSDRYLGELSAPLLGRGGEPAPEPRLPYRLVVERGEDGIAIRPWVGSGPVSREDTGLTERQRRFAELPRDPVSRGRILEVYCETFGRTAPIRYRRGGSESPLTFGADRVRGTRTLLDVSSGLVTVRKSLDDGLPLHDDAFATEGYFFDIPAGRVECIANTAGWRLWDEVNRAVARLDSASQSGVVRDSRSISLGVREFRQLGLWFGEEDWRRTASGALFLVNGAPVAVAERPCTAEIRVREMGTGEEMSIQCAMEGTGASFDLSVWPFAMFTEAERWRFAPPLKTKKRFAAVATACFDLLACQTAREEQALLKSAFSGDDFLKRKVKSEAKQMATAFARGCVGRDALLVTDGAGWALCAMAKRDQARLLEIPFRIFGPAAFAGAQRPGELRVSRGELIPRLPLLKAQLEAYGWQLFFNDKPLRTVTWEVTLDATRSSIDWFELRPEVRCDGAEVSRTEMAEALSGGGIYEKGGEFVILDSGTAAVLSLLPGEVRSGKGEPVRIPRLRILDWLALRRNGVTVRLSPEDEWIFTSLASLEALPQTPLPEGLQATLRHYQAEGYHWLAFLYGHRFGACLADDMGLGKTIQALSFLAGLHEGRITSRAGERLPHLIVVPPSLLFNWENEIARFCPQLSVVTYRGTDRSTDFAACDVVLTSYGIVQRDAEKLAALRFHVIVFDEAQAVKNIQTGTTGACRGLKGLFTLTLTGTPVENHLGEYYSVMDISVPGLLGEYGEFRRSMNTASGEFLEMLIRRTRPFILRRTKQMIAAELPPKIESDIYLELTERQKALYTKTVAEVRRTVDDAYQNRTAGQARIIALTAILRLRQLCLSPEILLPKHRETSPKVEFLVEQLEELFDEGHSVLVFSQFTSFLDIVERALAGRGLSFMRLDGSTPVPERKTLVTAFQKSEAPAAFLLSLKAGGRGLNLTRATYVFHLDPWWNPAVEDQASDRAHRLGQTRQVTITRLVMRHTIEEKMMELKKRKLALYKALLEDASHGGAAGISREDFDFLLE
jgi:non-specific serine/threonine protein kinase